MFELERKIQVGAVLSQQELGYTRPDFNSSSYTDDLAFSSFLELKKSIGMKYFFFVALQLLVPAIYLFERDIDILG